MKEGAMKRNSRDETRAKKPHRFNSRTVFLFVFIPIAALTVGFFSGCATLEEKRDPVTVPEIVQMSKDGVPPKEIIQVIRKSGTVYRLKASQLAQVKEEGVSDQVIDYMQQTYLHAVRRNQALEDWGSWNMADDGFWYGGFPYAWPDEWYAPLP